MLRPDRSIERVYLHRAPVDMRKQIDGLVILAKDVIQQEPTGGALFAFINARRNKLKLLVWERYANRVIMGMTFANSCSLATGGLT